MQVICVTSELSGVFDVREFRINAPQGWTLKSVLQDITDTPLDLPPGQTVAELQIVITEQTTEVSGRVTDARGGVDHRSSPSWSSNASPRALRTALP